MVKTILGEEGAEVFVQRLFLSLLDRLKEE
jgi:hypothetical protein